MQFRGRKHVVAVGGVVAAAVALAACSSSSPSSSSASGTINASGSSFQNTFQQAAISAFKSVDSGITVNYASVGSGTGRSNLAAGTVLMAGSDSPIPSSDLSTFKGKTVLYFPVVIGPISLAYNLPGIATLKLSPTVIAKIFQGQITTWNDPAITALNPGVTLPSTAITTAVRSDSSGTTQNFTLFLQNAAPSVWTLGSSSTIKWPSTARAGAQNGGVASIVKSTSGAIGYVDYTDAVASGLKSAEVQNKAGDFVAPTAAAASTDAADATIASNLTFEAAWASSNAAAYPVTYQSWDLVYAKQPNANDATILKAYLGYLLGAGQKLLPALYYAPLPSGLDQKAVAQLSQITG
ncbi:MAG TPA: phosphate ABC transporter substrate-binding protein PstS [Trebonia sp.]|jgi:phosphate transport system substrate-binding protein|nr:phosphate ABC transporter substrate-binding protein PstS [Trebonia sp.]